MNNPTRTAKLNALTSEAIARHPNIRTFPFAELLAPDGHVDDKTRPDGLHLDPEAVVRLLDGWLGTTLHKTYASVITDPTTRLNPTRATAWSA
jgi:hypothetical protein